MKAGPSVPPWAAAVVIVVVLAVVGFFMFKSTGKKTMSASDSQKMSELAGKAGMKTVNTGGKPLSSTPPPGTPSTNQ